MFMLQYLPGRSIAVAAAMILLAPWRSRNRPPRNRLREGGDIEKALSDPQTAAAVDFVARRLRGNENVWYVMVLRTGHGRELQIALASGKTAAAVQIAKFLQQNPKIAAIRSPIPAGYLWRRIGTGRSRRCVTRRSATTPNGAATADERR